MKCPLTGNSIKKNEHQNALKYTLKAGKSPEDKVDEIRKFSDATRLNAIWRLQHHQTPAGFGRIT